MNMREGLTNLVPIERQRSFTREYLLRLGVVAAALVAALAVVATVLLIPTYVFLMSMKGVKTARLSTIVTTLTSSDEMKLSERLMTLSNDATTLRALSGAPAASVVIRSLLDLSRPGITLSGINYTRADKTKEGTLIVTGAAVTRDALRNYQRTLAEAPFAHGADLPVSAYAKDSNIPFTITITLVP